MNNYYQFYLKMEMEMQKKYKYKSVEGYYPPGARNPIRYINC